MSKSAVFFDKDGTLVENVPYNVDPSKIVFADGAKEALVSLKDKFQFHIITNQAGVALGLFEEQELLPVKNKLTDMFQAMGAELKGFHYCPHHPQGGCLCRKPGTLLFIQAAKAYNIDLGNSWMIGDILDDIEAGNRAGCRTILINNGNETEWLRNDFRYPHYTVSNLHEAAEIILSKS